MVKFLKENGFPCDLILDTEKIADELYKTKVIVNGEEVDEFSTVEYTSRSLYARGYLRALGHVIEEYPEEPEPKILCNYIKCAAGMGVAGNRNCFLKGDYTDPNCPKFYNEEEFLNDSGNK